MTRLICFALAAVLALTRHLAGPAASTALAALLSLAALAYCISLDYRTGVRR